MKRKTERKERGEGGINNKEDRGQEIRMEGEREEK
jgi:hypothetical protein